MKSFLLLLFLCTITLCDYTAPSKEPPVSIPLEKCPMFVSIGFDDNGYPDAMKWLQEYLAMKKNPAGNGNPATFDGTPARVTFYVSAKYGDTNNNSNGEAVIKAWQDLHADGHEIGNHSYTHGYMAGMDEPKQVEEIDGCMQFLTNIVKIPSIDITGFRAPYLNYNDATMRSLEEAKLRYDCSIEHSLEGDGTSFYWPYQLNEGSVSPITSVNVGSFPGIWEVPMNEVIIPQEHTNGQWHGLTGLDYNMWVSRKMSKEAFLATLKYTLDQRLAGNRAPFTFGAHSDYYSTEKVWDSWAAPVASLEEMREVFEQFIDYALSKPEVRLVPVQSIIEWMENPVALGSDVSLMQSQHQRHSITVQQQGDHVHLHTPHASTIECEIFTLQGKRVFQGKFRMNNSRNIAISGSLFSGSPGLYLIRVQQRKKSIEQLIRL